MSEWISVKERLPENGINVKTKIDDDTGIRQEQNLLNESNELSMLSTDLKIKRQKIDFEYKKLKLNE